MTIRVTSDSASIESDFANHATEAHLPNDYWSISVGVNTKLIDYHSQGFVCSLSASVVEEGSLSRQPCPCRHYPRCEGDR
jgi:hypothetical protein